MEPNKFPILFIDTLSKASFLDGPSIKEAYELQIYVKVFLVRVGEGNEIPLNDLARSTELRKSIFTLYTPEYIQQLKEFRPIEAERIKTIQELLTKSAPSNILLNSVLSELTRHFDQTEMISKISENNILVLETLQRFASLQIKGFDEPSPDLLVARNLLFKSKVQSITGNKDLSEIGQAKQVEALLKEFSEDMTPLLKKHPLFTKEALKNNLNLIEEEEEQLKSLYRGDSDKIGTGFLELTSIEEKSNSFESLLTYLYDAPEEEGLAFAQFLASLKAINLLLNPKEKVVEKHKNDNCILM